MLEQYINDSLGSSSSSIPQQLQQSREKEETQCYYCLMKQKFNIGDHKCFQHSVTKPEVDTGIEIQNQTEEIMGVSEMVEALNDVCEGLIYYWDHLQQISKGNPHHVQQQLQPVHDKFKTLQEQIGKFFFSPVEQNDFRPVSQRKTSKKKYQCAGSEKFFKEEISDIFDLEENNVNQSVKEWVSHFHKILHTRVVSVEDSLELPLQEELDMRLFKESMERKFLSFTQETSKYEKKIQQLFEKLIYYMEKSEGIVPNKKIQEDITFLEMESNTIQPPESEIEKALLLQAMSIEELLKGY